MTPMEKIMAEFQTMLQENTKAQTAALAQFQMQAAQQTLAMQSQINQQQSQQQQFQQQQLDWQNQRESQQQQHQMQQAQSTAITLEGLQVQIGQLRAQFNQGQEGKDIEAPAAPAAADSSGRSRSSPPARRWDKDKSDEESFVASSPTKARSRSPKIHESGKKDS